MPWTITSPVYIYLIITIPLFILVWTKIPADKLTKLLVFLSFLLYNVICYFIINWAVVYYYSSFLPAILSFAIFLRFLLNLQKTPNLPKENKFGLIKIISLVILLVILALVNYRVVYLSYRHTGDHALLLFPLRSGMYTAVNAGNGVDGIGMNNHITSWFTETPHSGEDMGYGVDVMKLGIAGMISENFRIMPDEYIKYNVYNDPVYSPCFGPVIHVEDGKPNLELFGEGDKLGNFVVLQCVDYFITLGNLKAGTIVVQPGDRLTPNRLVGQVGNSSSPGVPHFHIHATKGGWKEGEGTAIPMLFDSAFAVNDFWVRNELFIGSK